MAHLRKRKGKSTSYEIFYNDPRTRKQKTITVTPTSHPEEDQKKAIAIKLDIENRISLHKNKIKEFTDPFHDDRLDNITLFELTNQVANDPSRKIEVASKTLRRNSDAMKLLMGVLGKDIPVVGLSRAQAHGQNKTDYFKQFKEARFKRMLQKNSEKYAVDEDKIKRGINRDLSNIKAVFSYAAKVGIIPESYLPKIEMFKTRKRLPQILEPDEIIKILNQLDESESDILNPTTLERGDSWLCYVIIRETGQRRCAIVRESLKHDNGLKWKHIQWMRNTIETHDKGKTKTVPMTDNLKKVLAQRWQELSPNVSPDDYVIKYTKDTITHKFKKAMINAGVNKEGSVHILRHTLPVELLDAGASAFDVKEWLGHEDISSSQIYTHIRDGRLQKLAKRLSKNY